MPDPQKIRPGTRTRPRERAGRRLHTLSVFVGLTIACTIGSPAHAQGLGDLLRRAVEQTVREVLQPPPAAPAPATPSTPAPVAAEPSPPAAARGNPPASVSPASLPPASVPPASPAVATDAPAAPTAPAETIETLERRLADGPRTVDLRNGTPPELADRFLPEKGLIVLTNPYAYADRRFLEKASAMACHPQGGLVLYAYSERYAPSAERGRGREYVDNGTGLWRIEADGRVRPIKVTLGRERDNALPLCGVPITAARGFNFVRVNDLAVERNGDVLVAATGNAAVLRYRADGMVERVAGGGPNVCTVDPAREHPERGYRDGPGRDALFSGDLSIAVNETGEIFVLEGDGSGGNCSLRRIDTSGSVSTVQGNGKCEPYAVTNLTGHRTPAYERVAVDAQGRPLMMGSNRSKREGTGPDVVYTKVHRIDQGREELLGRAGHGSRFDPLGRLVAVGTAPDGTPLAFNAGYYSDAGLVVLENRPQFRYWWRSAPGAYSPVVDGPRGQAVIQNANAFCTGVDGYVYVLSGNAIRRIDPRSGEVSTWLQ